jgi:hypothetical protein
MLVVSGCSVGKSRPIVDTATPNTMPVPPPAISSIDNTVTVKIALADSFDVLPNGKCAARSSNVGPKSGNMGMSDGARVQLRGDTVGGSVWSVATAQVQRRPPQMSHGKPLVDDDGLYCVVKVVFAPTRPDPSSSYSLKFEGGDWWSSIKVGRAPYGQLDRPGYGSVSGTIMTCRSLLDPPEKDCPEPGN